MPPTNFLSQISPICGSNFTKNYYICGRHFCYICEMVTTLFCGKLLHLWEITTFVGGCDYICGNCGLYTPPPPPSKSWIHPCTAAACVITSVLFDFLEVNGMYMPIHLISENDFRDFLWTSIVAIKENP